MAAGSYERKEFVGGAPATTLAGALAASATSCVVAGVTGWPTASPNPFVAVIDRDTASEEKILVRVRTGTTFTTIVRGYDDTTPVAHSDGAAVEHALDASTIDQVNRLANLMAAKGQVISHNGTNPTMVAAAAMDGSHDERVLMVDSAAATGVKFARPEHLKLASTAPPVAGVQRIWFDETVNLLRTSDGATWIIPAQIPYFATTGARTTYLGGDPLAGTATIVGTGAGLALEVYDGTVWVPISRRDEGIPKFANVAGRNAFYPAPVTGDHAYMIDTHQLLEYRVNEWISLNQKISISDTAPTAPRDGDVWLQPT